MSNELYDKIKLLALAVPMLTCISAVVAIIGVPYAPQITAVLAAISTALGDTVLIAKKLYEDKKKKEEGESDE